MHRDRLGGPTPRGSIGNVGNRGRYVPFDVQLKPHLGPTSVQRREVLRRQPSTIKDIIVGSRWWGRHAKDSVATIVRVLAREPVEDSVVYARFDCWTHEEAAHDYDFFVGMWLENWTLMS